MEQNHYNGLENGVLPWHHPLGHAPISQLHKQPNEQFGGVVQQGRRHGIKSPSSEEMNTPVIFEGKTRSSPRAQRIRNSCSGPGMQAVFLGPKTKSCGTGVFIPRGCDPKFCAKPAFSPVLLPCRVVEALNLNVQELGQYIKPQPEQKKNVKKIDEKLEKGDGVSFSPEIYLPQEWTY